MAEFVEICYLLDKCENCDKRWKGETHSQNVLGLDKSEL